jgi:hypothetical protein
MYQEWRGVMKYSERDKNREKCRGGEKKVLNKRKEMR